MESEEKINQSERRFDFVLFRRLLVLLHFPEAAERLEADIERPVGLPGDGEGEVDHVDDLIRYRYRTSTREEGSLRDRAFRNPFAHLFFDALDLGKAAVADFAESLPGKAFPLALILTIVPMRPRWASWDCSY
jgi:hypothetical protein